MRLRAVVQIGAVWALALTTSGLAEARSGARLDLRSGWEIQSSCKLAAATGEQISSRRYQPKGWIKATVPSTVLAAQLANRLVSDPFYGMNLRKIPGADYPVGKNFSNLAMRDNSPYHCSWWYRTEFEIPPSFHDADTSRLPGPDKLREADWARARHIALHFDGINYRANVWLNGKQIANSNDVAGTWRVFEFDVTDDLRNGGNVLAVEVLAPTENDLALTWVDWAPEPPDKDVGLWRPVYLTAGGSVTIRNPYVKTDVEPDLSMAHLSVMAELTNTTDQNVGGEVAVHLSADRGISQPVLLGPHETKTVKFPASQYPELNVQNPALWWPAEMGNPEIQHLGLSFTVNGEASESRSLTFGIRQVTSDLVNGQRLFRINGKPLLIRGGGWAPDLLLREDHKRLEDQFRMARDMGLNTIRLEGKLESDEFFDLADRYGILVMPGWCCCDAWEKWGNWTDDTFKVATASLADQIRRLRQHPSVFVWLNGSDNPPPPNVEQMYLDVLQKYDWSNPVVSSATSRTTEVSGPSGVKMNGPYDYVPPDYWLDDAEHGGAFGFATEISPGPAIPPIESVERFVPRDHLWPAKGDEVWNYHSGGGQFANLNIYTNALDQRYGPSSSLRDFERKSQAAAYEGERAMFEGYARNKYTLEAANERASAELHGETSAPQPKPWPATGVIQWMLNNAWPSMIWHLYDCYLVPGGGYYGTKEATKPLHVQYSYDDHSVVVISGPAVQGQAVSVSAETFTLEAVRKSSVEKSLQVGSDAVTPTGITIAIDQAGPEKTYFLRLQMKDGAGKLIDENLYWLSTQPDALDDGHATWYYTPQSQYADFTGLNALPAVKPTASYSMEHHGTNETARVRLRNPSKNLAFMVHLRVSRGSHGSDVTPVFWDDNYVSLFPGEERTITGSFVAHDLDGAQPVIEIDGWNVTPETLQPAPAAHFVAAEP
ncbi:MAG TPA: glycoside hydrolase family 2 TIM barrel-domain containing protein [Terriglobales bacterium]|nr:glycoside hydrolase family 2 TIM barrel-domain containing protein [Terriglobales bacterium]